MSTPEKPYPDLAEFDNEWTSANQRELEFIQRKYINEKTKPDENPEWLTLRRLAEKNKTKEDGSLNPHYYRMSMEADIARLHYEMGFMVRTNAMAMQELLIMQQLYQRVGLLEGAYSYLQSGINSVKSKYKESMVAFVKAKRELTTNNPTTEEQTNGKSDR